MDSKRLPWGEFGPLAPEVYCELLLSEISSTEWPVSGITTRSIRLSDCVVLILETESVCVGRAYMSRERLNMEMVGLREILLNRPPGSSGGLAGAGVRSRPPGPAPSIRDASPPPTNDNDRERG